MEKTGQEKVEYMIEHKIERMELSNPMNDKLWIDTRLSDEEIDFLWACISEENKKSWNHDLAGNIHKSELIEDKDNWFYETALKKLTEKMFYDDWDNYRKYVVDENEDEKPEFEMNNFWVNYQKQHEFNPLHSHGGLYSFVVFMKIPTHWKEQHALPFSANSNSPHASNFQFVWPSEGGQSNRIFTQNFPLSSKDEGRMLFFDASLKHMVYPFYGTEEERITISGNIALYDPNRLKIQKLSGDVYEEKKKMLKMLENSVKITKEELKQMKKESEKEGLN